MKFIHISDLHFYLKGDGRSSRNIRKALIPYLQELNISADELIITGDYRHAKFQGKDQAEIDDVVKYIKDIAKAIYITDVKHIHLVPGNHDRDRKKGEARKLAGIRNKYDPANGCFDEKDLDYLLQKFDYFRMVCDTLYGTDSYWGNNILHTYRVVGEVVFVYLNTAIMHNCDEDRKKHRLVIGNDCLDQLLNEIDQKYSDYPIIILAHHSPDYFEKHEKEAVEDILMQHPKVILYLCGDAHEAWLRKVNYHLEITMGCLKQEKGVETTFLYVDTDLQEYSVYHWVGAWEPYVAANRRIIKTIQAPSDCYIQVGSSEQPPIIIIPIDDKGRITVDANLRNSLLQWVSLKKRDKLRVELKVIRINQLTNRLTELQMKIKRGIALEEAEEKEYSKCTNEINRLNHWALIMKTACECFLKDNFMQIFCGIYELDDYLDMLSRIITNDPKEEFRQRDSDDYTTVDFSISRSNAKRTYYFTVPIRNQTLKDLKLNPDLMFMDIALLGISNFNIETRKIIYTKFYIDFANVSLYLDKTIQEDSHAKNLLNYNLGIH